MAMAASVNGRRKMIKVRYMRKDPGKDRNAEGQDKSWKTVIGNKTLWRIKPSTYKERGIDYSETGLILTVNLDPVAKSFGPSGDNPKSKYHITHHAFSRFMERMGTKTIELFSGINIKEDAPLALLAMHTLIKGGKVKEDFNRERNELLKVLVSEHWVFVLKGAKNNRIVTCYPLTKESESDTMSNEYNKAWKESTRKAAKEAGHYDGRFAPRTFKDKYQEEDKYLCREKIDPLEIESEKELEEEPEEIPEEKLKGPERRTVYQEEVSHSPFKELLDT